MKKFLFFGALFFILFTNAQVGINTTTPSDAAALDVNGDDGNGTFRGFMPPRVPTESDRDNNIPTTSVDIGLIIFVEDINCLQIFNGTDWESVYCLGTNPGSSSSNSAWVNEFHYNNQGADIGEFVEIAGTAGTDLTGYTLFFTNGALGNVYQTLNLSGIIPDDGSGFGTLSFITGFDIQNGAVDGDGIALIDPNNIILQNLSYENTFTINEPGNVLNGLSTTLIGVAETNTTPVGESLQLIGTGNELSDFTWSGPIVDTPGAVNTGQTFN